MTKVAVLGMNASGKTVLLAGLGQCHERADADGYFLVPESRETMQYVKSQYACLKRGEWPRVTVPDAMQQLRWTLRRRPSGSAPRTVGELTVLDFSGEVYRAAFEGGPSDGIERELSALREYVRGAQAILVLMNLSDLVVHGADDPRVQDTVWSTKKVLDFADATIGSPGDLGHRVALVFSQADRYSHTLRNLGGAKRAFGELLPTLDQCYVGLDVLSAHAVDGTEVDGEGEERPLKTLTGVGLKEVWRWLIERCVLSGGEAGPDLPPAREEPKPVAPERTRREAVDELVRSLKQAFPGCGDLYEAGHIPAHKQLGAYVAMKVREDLSDVRLLFDGTLFGGSRDGIVMTSRAYYCKDLWENPLRVAWEDVARFSAKGSNLVVEPRRGKGGKVLMTSLKDAEVRAFAEKLNEQLEKGMGR